MWRPVEAWLSECSSVGDPERRRLKLTHVWQLETSCITCIQCTDINARHLAYDFGVELSPCTCNWSYILSEDLLATCASSKDNKAWDSDASFPRITAAIEPVGLLLNLTGLIAAVTVLNELNNFSNIFWEWSTGWGEGYEIWLKQWQWQSSGKVAVCCLLWLAPWW